MAGSTALIPEACGARTYVGGPSALTAFATVFLEIPNRAAIDLIDSPSARCNRRISAQSSTVITHPIVWNGWLSFQPSQWLTFRPSPTHHIVLQKRVLLSPVGVGLRGVRVIVRLSGNRAFQRRSSTWAMVSRDAIPGGIGCLVGKVLFSAAVAARMLQTSYG
jgi:hypothetical protein